MKANTTFLLFIFSLNLFAQKSMEEMMENYHLNYIPEKVFVHTDKTIYAGGETIWLAAYLVNGSSHQPGTASDLLRIELKDGNGRVVVEQKLFIENGYAAGELSLSAKLSPGYYQLTAFTNYQRNSGEDRLFKKTIQILSGLKEITGVKELSFPKSISTGKKQKRTVQLRFFPEGGDCVAGVPCRVAFVAEDKDGFPLSVQGELVDLLGNVITNVQTNEDGIGNFIYLPQNGHSCQVKLSENSSFELPLVLEKGYHLSVRKRKGKVRIGMETNLPEGLKGTRLVMHLRGNVLVDKPIEVNDKKGVINLLLDDLLPGVYVYTLFDPDRQPVAERLFFHAPREGQNSLLIHVDQESYNVRSPIDLKMSLPMEDVQIDSLAKGMVSLSVLPLSSNAGPKGDDICTWLLLNSDLDIPIPYSPELLFATDSMSRDQRVDEFLLTRGWRRFQWEMIATDADGFKPEYPVEQGLYLQGKMGKFNNLGSPRQGSVALLHLQSGFFEETETDENGHFSFGPSG